MSENTLRQTTKTGMETSHRISFSLYKILIAHSQSIASDDFIFTEKGRVYPKDKLYNIWREACRKAQIEYITLYEASRHSRASQIRRQKETEALQEAAKELGHTNYATTKRNYILPDSREIR